MTTTALVWVLIVSAPWYAGMVSYSPPVATLADCERLKESLARDLRRPEQATARCVQINIVFPTQGAKQ